MFRTSSFTAWNVPYPVTGSFLLLLDIQPPSLPFELHWRSVVPPVNIRGKQWYKHNCNSVLSHRKSINVCLKPSKSMWHLLVIKLSQLRFSLPVPWLELLSLLYCEKQKWSFDRLSCHVWQAPSILKSPRHCFTDVFPVWQLQLLFLAGTSLNSSVPFAWAARQEKCSILVILQGLFMCSRKSPVVN